ncbi:hypothetical protein D1BOALGB6SA_8496 [Olavius sp. associated proteobacterium Delta 1]|nr:hypothetical protein D1BOALGB6SA_8496 [Olavius sp. associated proteobacterium Delta 1]
MVCFPCDFKYWRNETRYCCCGCSGCCCCGPRYGSFVLY